MPTYQYVCTSCERPLEVQQSFSDAALAECPACAGRLRKVFSAVGVVFKGSGFYRNDSRVVPSGDGSSNGADAKGGTDGDGRDGNDGKDGRDGRDPGSKKTGSKDTGSKDTGSKDTGSKGARTSDTSGSDSSSAKPAGAASGSSSSGSAS